MTFKPFSKDRLGARKMTSNTYNAQNLGVTAIPATESVILVNWVRFNAPSMVLSEVGLRLDKGGTDAIAIQGSVADPTRVAFLVFSGVAQYVYAPFVSGADACYALVLDRDHNVVGAYLDGTPVDSAAIANDPDLTAVLRAYFMANAAGVDQTVWRSAVLSIATGACPAAADLGALLKGWVNPDAPIPAALYALKGSSYKDYRPGQLVLFPSDAYVEDSGDDGDDLQWQGGVNNSDIRARSQCSLVRPRYTWYGMKPGYDADTGVRDFGGVAGPVVARAVVRATKQSGSGFLYLIQAGGEAIVIDCAYIHGLTLSPFDDGGAAFVHIVGARGYGLSTTDILDLVYVQHDSPIGSTTELFVNGNLIHSSALGTGALSLAGDFRVAMYGSHGGQCCRFEVWQPAAIPADYIDRIRAGVRNVEADLDFGTPIIDFPLNSDTMPLGTETVLANQGLGGGTMTLSAARSTSCKIMIAGV